ncbi:MAG: hypothetical protein ACRCYY_03590 [Trueperaceae bacterium]
MVENMYLKEMEQQLKVVAAKVNRERVEVPLSQVEQKLEEVNQKFNGLRTKNIAQFEAQKVEFEEAFNELSRMVTDNSQLGEVAREEGRQQEKGQAVKG